MTTSWGDAMARFSKNVSEELKEFLTAELKRYEYTVPMTIPERHELHKWVYSGHSPYSCGCELYSDDGRECDFITCLRFWND